MYVKNYLRANSRVAKNTTAKGLKKLGLVTETTKTFDQIRCETVGSGMSSKNYCSLQSCYHMGHLTETALLRVIDDIMVHHVKVDLAMVRIGLNISAALIPWTHHTLLERLESKFAIHGVLLQWIGWYLSETPFLIWIG